MNKRLIAGAALATAAMVSMPLFAQPSPMGDGAGGRHSFVQARMHGGMHDKGGHGFMGERAMRDLNLTEAQRDQIFKIRHAQQPEVRAQMKVLREARTELRTLAASDGYTDAKAREIAERASKAGTEMAVLMAHGQNEFYKVLTPEQRKKLDERRKARAERGERGPRGMGGVPGAGGTPGTGGGA